MALEVAGSKPVTRPMCRFLKQRTDIERETFTQADITALVAMDPCGRGRMVTRWF